MAKKPKKSIRSSFSGTARQMEKIDSWAEEKGMKFSDFLHAAAFHYMNSGGEAAGLSDQSLEELASNQAMIVTKLDQILHAQKQPHPSKDKTPEHDAPENETVEYETPERETAKDDDTATLKMLEDQVDSILIMIDDVYQNLKRELPDRQKPRKYQCLTPKIAQLPAMEISLFLLDAIVNDLSVRPKGKDSVLDRLTQK